MTRHSFRRWDDAMRAARSLSVRTGVRHRVHKSCPRSPYWWVSPAVVRLGEVPC